MTYQSNEHAESRIRTDYSLSMKGNIKKPYGIEQDELNDLLESSKVKKIKGELREVWERRDDDDHFFKTELGVFNSPYDSRLREKVHGIRQTMEDEDEIKYVILAGIGGSELGASAAIQALGRSDRVYIPVTSYNDVSYRLPEAINPQKTVLIASSRKGKTPETNQVFKAFFETLRRGLPSSYKKHVVIATGDSGPFRKLVEDEKGMYSLDIEPEMSGRYTVFHAANLMAMELMGVDIDSLHKGGGDMFDMSVQYAPEEDEALIVAGIGYLLNRKKLYEEPKGGEKVVFNTSVFTPRLTKYGEWLDQLMEESLGRPGINISAKTTELPNKAHSNFQNWVAGGNNMFYHQFVVPLSEEDSLARAAYLSISQALAENGCPSFTTFLDSVNAQALGQLFMRDMLRIVYMGELFGVDEMPGSCDSAGKTRKWYFQQPDVELYKKIMGPLLVNPEEIDERWNRLKNRKKNRSIGPGGDAVKK